MGNANSIITIGNNRRAIPMTTSSRRNELPSFSVVIFGYRTGRKITVVSPAPQPLTCRPTPSVRRMAFDSDRVSTVTFDSYSTLVDVDAAEKALAERVADPEPV